MSPDPVIELFVGAGIFRSVPGLFALEIDPQEAAQTYRGRIVGPVRGVLPDGVERLLQLIGHTIAQAHGASTREPA